MIKMFKDNSLRLDAQLLGTIQFLSFKLIATKYNVGMYIYRVVSGA